MLAGLAAGLAAAIAIIMSVEAIGNQLFPPPRGYDMASGSAMTLPFQNLLFPVLGWFAGSLVGAWIAVRISDRAWTGWVIAALVLAATVFNFALITHPMWMMVAGVIAAPLGAWIGQQLARRTAAA
jgi:hypothetical protein